jgi:hypothetical protein
MNDTMAYSRRQLADRQQPQIAARQQAIDSDPDVAAARRTLEKAQSDYQSLQSYVKSLPLGQRLQYNGNVATAKEAISAAEKAVRTATNQHVRRDYLKKLEEQRASQQRTPLSEQLEAAAKMHYRPAYLASGGTEDQFESAWKSSIWPKMLEERAAAQMDAARGKYTL